MSKIKCKGNCNPCSDPCKRCGGGICEVCIYGRGVSKRKAIAFAIANKRSKYNEDCAYLEEYKQAIDPNDVLSVLMCEVQKNGIREQKQECKSPTMVISIEKEQIKSGFQNLIEELNTMRMVITTQPVHTPEEAGKRAAMMQREEILRDILYRHFGIDQEDYKDKQFIEIH